MSNGSWFPMEVFPADHDRRHQPMNDGLGVPEQGKSKERIMPVKHHLPHRGIIYSRLSRLYNPIFTRFFSPLIHRTIQSLDIPPGATVLEVGVGTGLSLEAYPPHAQVTAIDLSSTMLAQAQEKVDEEGWSHVCLREMDALNLQFDDEQFDYVMAFHVVTVVPDPGRLLREMNRVCQSDGRVVIINHFRSERRWLAPLVDMLDPVTRRIGWRTTLRLSDLVAQAPLAVERRFKSSARSLFTVVTARKETTVRVPRAGSRHPAQNRLSG